MPPLALVALLVACVHRVDVVTAPEGARVALVDRAGRVVPGDLARVGPARVELRPFGARRLEVSLPEYRTVTVTLPLRLVTWGWVTDTLTLRWRRAVGLVPAAIVELRLVEDHGGVGTWTPDEAP
jgi:hypothetical protein